MTMIKQPFQPIFNQESRVLILGSFPSVQSRINNFYYGHPQNRFWKVLSNVTDSTLPISIEEKINLLLTNKIALWDVIDSCTIVGSSDSSIKDVTPVNLSSVLNNSRIEKIYANGGTAYKLYNQYCFKNTGIESIKLPSTSPANASYSIEKLIASWKQIVSY